MSKFSIEQYVESLQLPTELESALESNSKSAVNLTDGDQLITIGSQIAEFASSVPAEIREDISNSLLLAQLAADKAVETPKKAKVWYESYIGILKNIGWLIEDESWNMQEIEGATAEVHKAIFPVVTAALGAGGVTSALILDLLEDLSDISKDKPWITLFDKASKRVYGGQFQISHIHNPPGGKPVMMAAFFGLDGDTTLVQVLFVKLSESSIKLSQGKTSLSINEAVFKEAAPKVKLKVTAFTNSFIDNLDLS